jgi:MFS family permease
MKKCPNSLAGEHEGQKAMELWNISWIATLLAAVAGFAVGGIWYGPLFSKAWQREVGLSDEEIARSNMLLIFGGTFLLNLIGAFILGHILSTYGRPGLYTSTLVGFGLGLAPIATSIGVNYLFARKSMTLFLIDAGYWVVIYTIMGVIFGLFA